MWVRHRCEQGTPGVLPGERWEGFYLGEEVGGQPHAFWAIWRYVSWSEQVLGRD